MADHDHNASPPQNLRPRRSTRQPSALDRDRIATSTPLGDDNFPNYIPDSNFTAPTSDGIEPLGQKRPRPDNGNEDERRRTKAPQRSHKHRSSGAFLLADAIFSGSNKDSQALLHKRQRSSAENQRHKAVQNEPDRSHTRGSRSNGGQGLAMDLGLGLDQTSSPDRRPVERTSMGSTMAGRDSLTGDTVVGSSPRASMAPMDVDSAQIVNMALNLSESRRQALRRNVSQPIPPKLAPLPDNTAGGSLRQHLQQQRRVSRTISPRPDRGSPKIGSARVFSPLQSAFEPDGTYRYHFSQSTLARAQKAKEYLELMAQYRRVLDLLPPLKPSRAVRLPASDLDPVIGRPYNPLQYIRNRKVRARERKVIDGEEQGFNDVIRVSEWVHDVAKWVATRQVRPSTNNALPVFAAAEAAVVQTSPPPSGSRPAIAATKPKRPRVDWALDPADMLADVYWLEQDDNKRLVEDRHWRRVFPQSADLYQPLSRDEVGPRLSTPNSMKDLPSSHTPADTVSDSQISKTEHDSGRSSARDRAHQKLRALKGSHHRQNSSINGRDFLRIHRGSLSDSSDTDSDRRRRVRSGTISSNGKDILAKQMEEMIAREQRETESHPLYDHQALRMKFASTGQATPEREKQNPSRALSRTSSHRRMESHGRLSEAENRIKLKARPSPPQDQGRASLEVPNMARRFSTDYDTSQPNSPELRAIRDRTLIPAIGMDLSPASSRPSSPSRNPLTKVKSIFRERSRDRPADMHSREGDSGIDPPAPHSERLLDSPATDKSGLPSPDRRSSRSPLRKIVSKGTDTSSRSHKITGSVRVRSEDGGLRGLFRGPRIDSVLRSGVSKVSDMIWRKEAGAAARDDLYSSTSSDQESDAGISRGRSRGTPQRATDRGETDASGQSGKSYLGVMPKFISSTEHNKSTSSGQTPLTVPGSHPASQPLSRRSSRFELLKPPKIDIQTISSSYTDGVRAADARLNAVLAFSKGRDFSSSSVGRQWSIADQGIAPIRATVSKREIARLRALLLSSGIHAMEMDRRAKERKLLISPSVADAGEDAPGEVPENASWNKVDRRSPEPDFRKRLVKRPIAQTDLYPLAARALGSSIQASIHQWQVTSDSFSKETAPVLEHRVEALRFKLAAELTDMTRAAAEEADEAYRDLVTGQRLKVTRVVDFIEKMLRRRRRRFRWVRRAGWLAVEWALVGFMWYVWFVVMIARVLLGVGKGVVGAVRWLLWL
ncbi:hypothetical protein B0T17DRAFT_607224 [Bombardia bombarda]|uniref:Uncharacterized protein n=1 Tax=Bombardia bombarda TaxID=252184 RepID=A0AA39XA82_9PEZI|nr:hypothetical protein B0T17DRAFT_607224 [Bombardia bombarda]